MAQSMRVHVRRQALRDRDPLDNAAHAARREPPPATVDQQSDRLLAGLLEDSLPLRQILCESSLDRIAKRNVTFFLALAANKNCFSAHPDVVGIDAGQLGIADSTPVEQFQD